MSDQCEVEVNRGIQCQRKRGHTGSHVAHKPPPADDWLGGLVYTAYLQGMPPQAKEHILKCVEHLRAERNGDGTPGPAREAALVEEACRLYDRGRARDFDTAPEGYKIFMREEIAPIVRMVLASGDSGGPRGAAPFDPLSPEAIRNAWRGVCDDLFGDECTERCNSYGHDESCPVVEAAAYLRNLRVENTALRAELGRAPNGWEPPDWVTGAFLNEMGAAYKLKCREDGREPWPAHFAMVDLIIWWWETQAKTRFKVGRAPAGGPNPEAGTDG